MSDTEDPLPEPEWAPGGGDEGDEEDEGGEGDEGDEFDGEAESASDGESDEGLDAEEAAGLASSAVRPLYVLPPAQHRTPRVLYEAETAQAIAALTDIITRHGTALPPEETALLPPHDFAQRAARREIELGLAPFCVRRDLGRTSSGAVITERIPLADLDKPHLPPREA